MKKQKRFNKIKVNKEKSAEKVIKEGLKKDFSNYCVHQCKQGKFEWCELGYKYCPYNKCADYIKKELLND